MVLPGKNLHFRKASGHYLGTGILIQGQVRAETGQTLAL